MLLSNEYTKQGGGKRSGGGRWGEGAGGVATEMRNFMNHAETQFRDGEYSSMQKERERKKMMKNKKYCTAVPKSCCLFVFIKLFCVIQTLDSDKYPQ